LEVDTIYLSRRLPINNGFRGGYLQGLLFCLLGMKSLQVINGIVDKGIVDKL